MSWLENIKNKPHKEKINLIYIICGTVAVLMIILWIFTSQIGNQKPADTSLFKTLKQGYSDFKDSWKNR